MPHQLHLAPTTTEEAAEILHAANSQNKKIEITGAGTKRSWGNPVQADILLSTENLTGLKEHPWQDLTATVAAGTTWSHLQTELAKHNQRVALDPLFPQTATVGGIIATNDSGALRAKYGSLRDLIIGMTIVLADGTIAKSGGKVVKNVAGYDLHKLMTGAFGTLGLITEVTFRLHPLPAATETWTITAPDTYPLGEILSKIRNSHLVAEAVQLRCSDDGCNLDVRLASTQAVIEDHSSLLQDMAAPLQVTRAEQEVWSTRETLFDGDHTVIKCGLPLNDLANNAAHLQWTSPDVTTESVTYSSGIQTAQLRGEDEAVANLVKSMQLESKKSGWNLFVAAMPQGVRNLVDPWGKPPSSIHVMKEIKSALDHLGTINYHRFLDHI